VKVPQLKRESLREAVIRLIEEALLNGELQPGDRIVEAEVAQRAGISRGPVREAIRQLVGESILVSYPSRGTFVTQWVPQAVEEAYTLRAVLERFVIQEAIEHITPEDIAQLQVTVDEMDRSARLNDVKALVRLDVRFHEQLYALSGHSLLQRMLSQLRRRLYCLMAMDQGFADHRDEIAADHQSIIDALKAGDPTTAGEIIADHILATGAEVVEQVRAWSKE
jgi:DNA-binding GntR family transcriptional regulator